MVLAGPSKIPGLIIREFSIKRLFPLFQINEGRIGFVAPFWGQDSLIVTPEIYILSPSFLIAALSFKAPELVNPFKVMFIKDK